MAILNRRGKKKKRGGEDDVKENQVYLINLFYISNIWLFK
jgi:hypothetical protein